MHMQMNIVCCPDGLPGALPDGICYAAINMTTTLLRVADANKECPVLGYTICFCRGPAAAKNM